VAVVERSKIDMEKPAINQIDEIVTIAGIAAYPKVSKRPAFKLGGTWRFRGDDLDKRIASRIGQAMVDDDEEAV
jgi:hypothetical protein